MDISTHTGYHTDTYRGTPYRIRTGVAAVKGQCPRPLDEGCRPAPVERIELQPRHKYYYEMLTLSNGPF